MIKFKLKPLNVDNRKRFRSFLSSNEIRKRFIDYFVKENDHKYIKSSPVVPYNDPTIAFVNAGMCQFKSVLLGQRTLAANCVANSQKCIRVGGKHNDLDIVGSDGYHHTFFEMLGNWSFGHYGKAEACHLAWNLLTLPPFNIPTEQLYCTVFNGDRTLDVESDNETLQIWKNIGVNDDHIVMNGVNDNFWEMGETGPCGPCTEIHIDYPPSGGKNLIELWNIVFIQYSREKNTMRKLPNYFIDTGMGLERLTMVLQDKTSTYDTDLFSSIFNIIFNACRISKYTGLYDGTSLDTYYRVLADHGRMITVALSDNMLPSQNHKLRRLIRKSFILAETNFKIQPGYTLICDIANEVSNSLGNVYPELIKNNEKVKHLIKHEYAIFNKLRMSVSKDWKIMVEECPMLKSFDPYEECTGFVPACNYLIKHKNMSNIPAFTLYDAFGLEKKTIGRLAEVMGKPVNWNELYEKLKKLQTKTIKHTERKSNIYMTGNIPKTDDSFKYEVIRHNNESYLSPVLIAKLLAIVDINGNIVTEPDIKQQGDLVSLVLDKTSFYCKAGGQQNDIGIVKTNNGKVFDVIGVDKIEENGVVLHHINSRDWPILLSENELHVQVDSNNRLGLMRAHSSVHILNSVLNLYLVVTTQLSSCVKKDFMSFTFALFGQTFSPKDALVIEEKVKSVIQSAVSVKRTTVTSNDLNQINVTLLPGEVYPDEVHLIDMYSNVDDSYISREACCGTHVQNTLDVIDFCIVQYKCNINECTIMAVTGPLCTNARVFGQQLLGKSNFVEDLVNSTNLNNISPTKVNLLMDNMNQLKSELKSISQNYIPLKVQIQINKKIFAIERKIQKLTKEKKMQILGDAVKILCKDNYAVGYVDCDVAYLNDNCYDFENVIHICGEIPCLFLAYNKEHIHVYLRIPKEHPEDVNWLNNFWNKFDIKPIKFKNKIQFKATEFKVKQVDKYMALKLIDNVIRDVKKNYFSNV
ncbi:alanine--tRNA ligase, mitochondrial [Acyrthosiphon pisum]|uniref:alanine--tRNA ligase n=1 Tax=Acyrthosiphon pisum TaxID=7029 RepID=A0A8R2B2I9_ACYPI|nr:alanine--tRNA ligase, mitochondrial [Acyrthosiphon pisum]|eukprot:XP_008178686.1 PREDICTED: alanine--tRNA ligase, mitochondrial [Acyrthosiphon pisum]